MLRSLSERWIPRAAAAFLAAAALAASAPAEGQEGVVAGQVIDASSLQPLADAQVFLPDTELGTITDDDGRFRITGVPVGQRAVRVRLIGYRPTTRSVEVVAGETAEVTFRLAVSAVSLEEVVVTATGERRRAEVGNAIGTVDAAAEVEKSRPVNITDLLKGRSTGVSVQRSSGSVGTGSTLKIRGNTSISLDNTPLIYVDGARVVNDNDDFFDIGGQDASRLNDLNPEDIESIEVVKGPAAAALYGTEAAAGVLRITTKRGTVGDARYTFRAERGANWDESQWPASYWHPGSFGFSADTLYQMNLLDGSLAPQFGSVFDAPFRTGDGSKVSGTVRGGSEFVTYYVSGEWEDEEGNLPNNAFEKFNVRGNFNINPSDKVDISISNGITSNDLTLPGNDNNIFGYIGIALVGFPWERPVLASDPVGGGEPVESCAINVEIARDFGVPLSALGTAGCSDNPYFSDRSFDDVATIVNGQGVERYTGSGTVSYRPWSFLTNRVTVGYDEFSDRQENLFPVDPELPHGPLSQGLKFIQGGTERIITLDGTSTLDLDLTENLNSQFTVGGQWFRQISELNSSTGTVLPAGCEVVSCAATTQGTEAVVETRNAGFFFQEQLGWKDRLFVTPSIRFDDNSAFGDNLGLQSLPSINASYLISEEAWFPTFFDQARLRAAWGRSGLQPGPFQALEILNPVRTTFGGNDLVGVSPIGGNGGQDATRPNQGPGNPDLKPETGEEWEAGLDLSVLEGRLSLEGTYYRQVTSDAITNRALAPSLGFPGPVTTNIGEIVNRGLEFGLDAVALNLPDLSWDWSVTFSTNDGEITELESPIFFGGDVFVQQAHKLGRPFGGYYDESVSIDENGLAVVSDTAVFLGHPTPEYEGAVATTATLFDRVTLYGLLDFAGGHQQVNLTQQFQCGFLGGGAVGSVCGATYQRKPNGEFTDAALIKQAGAFQGTLAPWIEDAAYARLRTVSVRFELPDAWARAVRTRGASLSLTGENLAVWTGYDGVDPELNSAGQNGANFADFFTLPPTRRIVGSLSLTF